MATRQLTEEETEEAVAYELGFLDRKHNMGYSGGPCRARVSTRRPLEDYYRAGYCERGHEHDPMGDAQVQREELVMRGWY